MTALAPLASLAAFGIAVVSVAACARPDPLLQPRPATVAAAAPDSFTVDFETSRGTFTLMARRAWSPHGVDRLHYLVANGFYDDSRFFRVIPGFVAQFGLPADPSVAAAWKDRAIPDDPVRASNVRGMVSFARAGRDTRGTQLFVNLRDNSRLDTLGGFGFAPVGEVIRGMEVVDSLHSGYGESSPRGRGPIQDSIALQGSPWLDRNFPELDRIVSARITGSWGG
jgi:peptidyl-prolyl cis-trans isomerase A (cyclophilin A)